MLINKLKENFIIRSLLFKIFDGWETSRVIKGIDLKLYFNAGTNFNFFFRRKLQIEKEAVVNLTKVIKEDFLVYDIGANIGYYTIVLSDMLKAGKVISFEPDKDNLKYLKKNITMNSLQNVVIVNKAVSDEEKESKFYKDINTGRTSSIESKAWHPTATKIREEIVQTITLNQAAMTFGIPKFIKCDVEGHEVAVLNGASEILPHKPILFLEVKEENRYLVFNILKKFKYDIYDAEKSLEYQHEPLKFINYSNILCV